MAEFWQNVDQCNYCGSPDRKLYLKSDKPAWFQKKPLIIEQCLDCDLCYASPRPDPNIIYEDFLQGGKSAQSTVERKLNRPNVLAIHKRSVEHALKFVEEEPDDQPKKLFDMGCGAGTIMEAGQELGLVCEGNDINLSAIERLRSLGFTAYHGFSSDIDAPENKYDIIINFDYLEHSYHPFDDLLKCARMLRMGGILYAKTLYLDCPDHILKGDSYQLFGAGHFHYFPTRTLCSMIASAGFKIIELKLGNLVFIVARKTGEIAPPKAYNLKGDGDHSLPFSDVAPPPVRPLA